MAKAKGKLVITGYEEILKDIESLNKEVPEVIKEALEMTAKATNKEYENFIKQHRYSGITEESLARSQKAKQEGNKIIILTGFDIKKGGLASIFLDRGTPKTKPYNFVRKIKKSIKPIKVFEAILNKAMRG